MRIVTFGYLEAIVTAGVFQNDQFACALGCHRRKIDGNRCVLDRVENAIVIIVDVDAIDHAVMVIVRKNSD